jgi:hypothetical protein
VKTYLQNINNIENIDPDRKQNESIINQLYIAVHLCIQPEAKWPFTVSFQYVRRKKSIIFWIDVINPWNCFYPHHQLPPIPKKEMVLKLSRFLLL